MFDINKIISALLALVLVLGLAACKNKNGEDYIESGELVVLEDTSDIKLGIYGIDTLNPLETRSKSVLQIVNIIYEPLFEYDEKRNLEGVLAQSYVLSSDGRQITVSLKDNIKWHDGTNFTADDVVYTLSKMRYSSGFYRKTADRISSFTAIDKNKIIISLEKPEPDFAYCLNFPIISKNSGYTKEDNYIPMGTGSYKFQSRNSTAIALAPNTAWHGDTVSKKNISVKVLKNEKAVSDAFNVNELDAVTSNELDITSSAPKANAQTKTIVSDNMVFLGFNTQGRILSDANIRKAIAALLDKQKLVDNDAYGHGVPASLAVNPMAWAYCEAKEEPSQDRAEDMILQAGYAMEDGVFCRDGVPLCVKLLVNSENEGRLSVAKSICETLNTSGFSAELIKADYEDYLSRINSGSFDMFLGEIVVDANVDPATMLTGKNNYFGFYDESLNNAVSALYGVSDRNKYKEAVSTFLNIFNANPPYIPLYFKTEYIMYGSYVSGLVQPAENDAFRGIEKWYFYDKDGRGSAPEKENDNE